MSEQTRCIYEFGPFRLDVEEHLLLCDGRPVALTPKAFETLTLLVGNSGRIIDKEELIRRLWPDSFVEEANLTVNVSQLRKALGKGEQYIETIPKRGYRFVATVREIREPSADLIIRERTSSHIVIEERETSEPDPAVIETTAARVLPVAALTVGQPAKWARRRVLQVAIVVALLTGVPLAAYLITAKRRVGGSAPPQPNRLAILPFRNLRPSSETDFLGPAMADAVISKLGQIPSLMVRPSSYVQQYRNQEIDPRVVAAELAVDRLLTGSFLKDGDDVRVTAQLIDVARGEILWRATIDVKYVDLLAMEDRVADQIIKGLQLNLSPQETERLKLDAAQNPLAYEDFLRGRYLISSKEHSTSIKLLEESTTLDPNYALAWTYLGKAYSVTASQYFGGREYYDKAKAAYEKALALKPRQVETRVLLANFLTENNRIEESVPMLLKVIEENPNHAMARWELSYAYRYAGMLDQSIAEGEQALKLYPHLTGHLFNSYLYAGQYEKFISSLPMRDDAYMLFYRGLGNYYLKDWQRASLYFDRAYQLDASPITSQLGRALRLGLDGRQREGIALMKVAESKLAGNLAGDGEISYKLAQTFAVLGDNPAALRWLRASIDQGFFCYPYFLSDPLLDHLHGDREYAVLIGQARQRHEQFKRQFFSS